MKKSNDINLLVQRSTAKSSIKKWVGLLIAVVFFAGALYAGITIPADSITTARMQITELNDMIQTDSNLELDLIEKRQNRNALSDQLDSLETIAAAKSDILMYIETIEKCLPTQANITQLSIFEQTIDITGIADNDEIIATFYLRLRESNLFLNLYVSTSTVMEDESQMTMFRLTGSLPASLTSIPLIEVTEENMTTTNEEAE